MDRIADSVSISLEVYRNIVRDFTESESGAVLGIRQDGDIVSEYYYDEIGSKLSKSNEYIPDAVSLDCVISNWSEHSICLWGILHSHPAGYERLSQADILYAVNFCRLNRVEFLHMPLFIVKDKQLLDYKVFSDGHTRKAPITIL